MRYSILLAAAASALSLAACTADDMSGATAAGDVTPETRGAYVEMAGAGDLFEIQSSQLALSKAQTPAVREFAQMMITHHSQTTQQLTAAAVASGVASPAPQLMPMQIEMMSQLQAASSANFDKVYMTQQVQAHQMALALHSNYARSGDAAALRAAAAAAVPVVTQHLARARELD